MTPAADQAKVLFALEGLVGQAPQDYPPGAVERWRPDKDLFAYHLPLSDGEFLVFFMRKTGRFISTALAPKERYAPYRAGKA